MSTVVPAPPARPFIYDDLQETPDDGYRREIIGGALLVNPAPVGRHQQASGALYRALWQSAPVQLLVLVAPYDWRLPDGGSVQPDLMVVRRDDFDPDGPFPVGAIPLLVVEVLSPSSIDQDRSLKRAVYQRHQVPAYWIVDPGSKTEPPSLTALRLHDGRYEIEGEVAGTEPFSTDWPFPVEVVPTGLAT